MADIVPSARARARACVERGIKNEWLPERAEITPEWVAASFAEAGRTLLALRASGLKPADTGSAWPDVVRDSIEAYGWTGEAIKPAAPSSRAIEHMDFVYTWTGLLPEGKRLYRRILALRGLMHPVRGEPLYSWRRIATVLGCSATSVERWHKIACAAVSQKLHHILENVSGANRADDAIKPPILEPEACRPVIRATPSTYQRPQTSHILYRQGDVICFREPEGSHEQEIYYIVWAYTLGVIHAIPVRSLNSRKTGGLQVTIIFDGDDDGGEYRAHRYSGMAWVAERRHFKPSDVFRFRASVGDAVPRIAEMLAKMRGGR